MSLCSHQGCGWSRSGFDSNTAMFKDFIVQEPPALVHAVLQCIIVSIANVEKIVDFSEVENNDH